MTQNGLYIGLMSGTSIDAIDACIVEIIDDHCTLKHHIDHPIPNSLKDEIISLSVPGDNEINRMKRLDRQLGFLFAEAVLTLLKNSKVPAESILAIGSHGQTIRHNPNSDPMFSLQIGDPNTIAELTGITTVADFRQRDVAAGGQGAPLLPSFHLRNLIQNTSDLVLNIGGIANVTLLETTGDKLVGFDTGPGNMLMDHWCKITTGKDFDKDGEWASSGKLNQSLLEQLKSEGYFKQPYPKSTGRELFNPFWLEKKLNLLNTKEQPAEDIQRTLLSFTAETIAEAINPHSHIRRVICCGGGARNKKLIEELTNSLDKKISLITTDKLGIAAEWVEATAFAWYAYNTLNGKGSNVPSCTGAKGERILGGMYRS